VNLSFYDGCPREFIQRHNSIELLKQINLAYSTLIVLPLKEAKNTAPGVNPGKSISRTYKLRRSGIDAFNPTNILDLAIIVLPLLRN
jgi:hypothetical protein